VVAVGGSREMRSCGGKKNQAISGASRASRPQPPRPLRLLIPTDMFHMGQLRLRKASD